MSTIDFHEEPLGGGIPRRQEVHAISPVLAEMLSSSGHTDARVVSGKVCAIKRFGFTTALVVGIDEIGYDHRYCYERAEDARAALLAWGDRNKHPSGPWIKCKGAGLDLLNPEFANHPVYGFPEMNLEPLRRGVQQNRFPAKK